MSHDKKIPSCVAIHVFTGNREEIAYIHDLYELSAWIDDWSTDHCEGSLQIYMHLDGVNRMEAVNIWCEEGDI